MSNRKQALGPYAAPGAILSDALYTLDEAASRLGWGGHAFRAARQRGLRIHRCGKRGYVTGKELIEFITTTANRGQQS